MKTFIMGASAGLGRALAEQAAAKGSDVLLVASGGKDLEVMAADLRLRHGVRAEYCACRISGDGAWTQAVGEAIAAFGEIDVALFPIGYVDPDDDCTLSGQGLRSMVEANFTCVAELAAMLLPGMMDRGRGSFVGFGSVGAARGRRSNVAYAASKRALLSLFESLRHRAVGTGVAVQLYQIGYMATQNSFGRKLLFPLASPEDAAAMVLRHLDKDFGVRHLPWFWRFICLLVRLLPWKVYRKLNF